MIPYIIDKTSFVRPESIVCDLHVVNGMDMTSFKFVHFPDKTCRRFSLYPIMQYSGGGGGYCQQLSYVCQ